MNFQTAANAPLPTDFLPAERSSNEDIQRQCKLISSVPKLTETLEFVNELVVFLNAHRQVVYANKSALDYFKSHHGVFYAGVRWGEALNCIHAREMSGCGTTKFCRNCGAARAILAAQVGAGDVQECRIVQRGTGEAFDFKVATGLLVVDGERFSIFCALDISDQKRKEALEHVFFHDIMNTAGGLFAVGDMLADASDSERQHLYRALARISEDLVEQIQAQRDLAMAECNVLTLKPLESNSMTLLQEAILTVRNVKKGKIHIDETSQSVSLTTDRTLLKRVLVNMLKNAAEACGPEEYVTAGVRKVGDEIEFWTLNPAVMPTEVSDQVFQRSFTTKGEGRGLGTYSMKLLGEIYLGGRIDFTSRKGEGTRFFARFPVDVRPPRSSSGNTATA